MMHSSSKSIHATGGLFTGQCQHRRTADRLRVVYRTAAGAFYHGRTALEARHAGPDPVPHAHNASTDRRVPF